MNAQGALFGDSRAHALHLCVKLSDATSASVVALTLVFLCTCITLLFLIEITIADSSSDPFAIDVTRADACSTFSSINAASSAYSSLDTQTVFSPVPRVTPELLMSCRRKILSRPAMNETGEKIFPWRTPLFLCVHNGTSFVCAQRNFTRNNVVWTNGTSPVIMLCALTELHP